MKKSETYYGYLFDKNGNDWITPKDVKEFIILKDGTKIEDEEVKQLRTLIRWNTRL